MNGSAGMLIIYVVAFIAIFYFMAIRPQQKQRKAHQALLSSLKKGDQVVTAAGMYGTVKRVEDNIIVLEIAKGVSIKMARNAVAQVIRDKQEARAAAPEPRRRGAVAEIEEEASDEQLDVIESEEQLESEEQADIPEEEYQEEYALEEGEEGNETLSEEAEYDSESADAEVGEEEMVEAGSRGGKRGRRRK